MPHNEGDLPVLREEIESKVKCALSMLLERDCYLLEKKANERSITHRLGIYLQEVFPKWDVDCEYNRDYHETKRLHLVYEGVEEHDTNGRTVYPDIIVHKRDTKCNLLVIEVKKSSSQEPDCKDKRKLCAFKSDPDLRYSHSLFLKLNVGKDFNEGDDSDNYKYEWIEC